MPKDVVMPRLSDTMSEGTVAKWRKRVGDEVKKGEIIAEIETDKATQDLESYDSGILTQILVNEGETVPLGTTIAVIAAPNEVQANGGGAAPAVPGAPAAPPPSPTRAAPAAAVPTAAAAAPAPVREEGERIKASPVARRLAQEHGVDLAAVSGTGPEGRIVKEDIEHYLAQRAAAPPAAAPAAPAAPPVAPTAPPVPAPEAPVPVEAAAAPAAEEGVEYFQLNRMQQTIARRMVQSRREAPYFYATTEIDMGEAGRFRRSLNEALAGETSVSFNDLVVKACALALQKFPVVNASWADGQLALHKAINVGFAVAVPAEQGPGGLVVPVIRNADQKSLRQIAMEAKALIEKARNNRLSETDMAGATFSISNLGMYDIDQFTAIISPPQSAILAVGAIVKKPVVKDDQIVVGERMRVTLSVDHRVIYGLTAAQFLQELKRILEHPLTMV
jgi:pyruvate dehydrogenase E2 component (dihydrolipoamide acetyltransferase)